MSYGPYHFFNDIGNDKKRLIDDPIAMKDFKGQSFVVCRALSFHIDSILIVERINRIPNMTPESQYDYLMARIRKARRKWNYAKVASPSPELSIISRHYGISYEKAVEAEKLLSPEFVQSLIELYDEGGRGNAPRKKRK